MLTDHWHGIDSKSWRELQRLTSLETFDKLICICTLITSVKMIVCVEVCEVRVHDDVTPSPTRIVLFSCCAACAHCMTSVRLSLT
jgi:hypothetical protein